MPKSASLKRDDLLAEMKFATNEDASATKDFAAATYLEHMFPLVMDLWNEGDRTGLKGMYEKKTACKRDLEDQLKARNWTGMHDSCKP